MKDSGQVQQQILTLSETYILLNDGRKILCSCKDVNLIDPSARPRHRLVVVILCMRFSRGTAEISKTICSVLWQLFVWIQSQLIQRIFMNVLFCCCW